MDASMMSRLKELEADSRLKKMYPEVRLKAEINPLEPRELGNGVKYIDKSSSYMVEAAGIEFNSCDVDFIDEIADKFQMYQQKYQQMFLWVRL